MVGIRVKLFSNSGLVENFFFINFFFPKPDNPTAGNTVATLRRRDFTVVGERVLSLSDFTCN